MHPGLAITLAAGLSLLLAYRRRRRAARRAFAPAAAVILLLLSGGQARAQAVIDEEPSATRYETTHSGYFDFKVGPYFPAIDGELGGRAHPYRDTFGAGSSPKYSGEYDYLLLDGFGTLSVGLEVGYFTNSAKAFITGTTTRSGDDTAIKLIPVSILAAYRFDRFLEAVPLMPYARIGLNYTFWWIDKADGETATFTDAAGNRDDGRGGTPGWQVSGGLALNIDFLDPAAARTMDNEVGINNTFLFFEVSHVAANGLWMKNKLHVGDTNWLAGISFEF
jgi:hypothetical protein